MDTRRDPTSTTTPPQTWLSYMSLVLLFTKPRAMHDRQLLGD